MKTAVLFTITLIFQACNSNSIHPPHYDTSIVILVDRTDPLTIQPNPEQILHQLEIEENIWQGIHIEVAKITDTDVSASQHFSLPWESRYSNIKIKRKRSVSHFQTQFSDALNRLNSSDTMESKKSIIFRTLFKHMHTLSEDSSQRRYLLIYSNLFENAELNFYDPSTIDLLRSNPEYIEKQLCQQLNNSDFSLSGIQIYILHKPRSYEDNSNFRLVSSFFKSILKKRGASVEITIQPKL
jgi:hypothetical protein